MLLAEGSVSWRHRAGQGSREKGSEGEGEVEIEQDKVLILLFSCLASLTFYILSFLKIATVNDVSKV